VIGTQGFYIDVTHSDQTREESITSVVTEIAVNRAGIEQAKGALMYVYRVDADAAFELLKWRSQETNVKLRALAEQLLADIRTLKPDDDESLPSRAAFDQLLLTAHQRIKAGNAAKDRQ
jgi:ANTAR domain